MRITCDQCGEGYRVKDESIPERGAQMTCRKCGHKIAVPGKAERVAAETPPEAKGQAQTQAPPATGRREEAAQHAEADETAQPAAADSSPKGPQPGWGRRFLQILFRRDLYVALVLAALVGLNLTTIPDKVATDYLDEALTNSATAYVASRGLNATISLIQDIEISAVAVSVSPGELLDPLNDLVERFSSVLLAAIVSLGVQKIFVEIAGWNLFKWAVVGAAVLVALYTLYRALYHKPLTRGPVLFYKALVLLLAVRFAVPFMAIASGYVEQIFINHKVTENIATLQMTNEALDNVADLEAQPAKGSQASPDTPPPVSEETEQAGLFGFWDNTVKASQELAKSVSDSVSSMNPKKAIEDKIDYITATLTGAIESTTDLIALFVVQSILLPLAFLYLLGFLLRSLYGYDLRAALERADAQRQEAERRLLESRRQKTA